MVHRLPASVLLLCALSTAADAQSRVWTITPFAAAAFRGDLAETVPGVGVAVERVWIPHVDVEAEASYLPDFTRRDLGIRTSVVTAGIGALPHVTVARPVVAYAEFGAAVVRFDPRGAGVSRADTEAAITSGAGVRIRLGARARLGADVRYIHVNNAPNFWRAYGGIGLIVRE